MLLLCLHIVCAVLVGKGSPSPDMSSALLFVLAEFCRQNSHYAYSGFQCGRYVLYQAFSALFQLCMVRNLNVPRLRTLRITSVGKRDIVTLAGCTSLLSHLKNRLMQDFQSRIWQGDQFIKSAQKQDLVFWWLQILLECSTNLRELSPIREWFRMRDCDGTVRFLLAYLFGLNFIEADHTIPELAYAQTASSTVPSDVARQVSQMQAFNNRVPPPSSTNVVDCRSGKSLKSGIDAYRNALVANPASGCLGVYASLILTNGFNPLYSTLGKFVAACGTLGS
ncbi:hypothetical protein C8J57DRAFT_1253184 [Mycena rebaudengoi]|nr:hypothetical protein C8J57DRAFT_1253184 [Mycena rebaudengoi]